MLTLIFLKPLSLQEVSDYEVLERLRLILAKTLRLLRTSNPKKRVDITHPMITN